MDIDYTVTTANIEAQQTDPLAPDEDVIWQLEFITATDPFTAYFEDPRAAVDYLAMVVANRLGITWEATYATENVLAYFRNPGNSDTFRLNRNPLQRHRGGGWPSTGERVLPIAPGQFQCVCDAYEVDGPFTASTRNGDVSADDTSGYVLHLGCGRVIDTSSALVVDRIAQCDNCSFPVFNDGRQWMHVVAPPAAAYLYCYNNPGSKMVAFPYSRESRVPDVRSQPMPGDAVRLVTGIPGAPAGSVGVIDGMVGEITGWSSITFNAGGLPTVYRDERVVRCSGGPGTISTDLSELQPTDTTQVLDVWRFRDGRRRAGNAATYQVRVPVWLWDPSKNA